MPKLRDMRPVDATFLDSSANAGDMTQALPCSATEAFDALKDPACWKAFLGLDVDWTVTQIDDNSSELQWRYAWEWGGPLEPVFGRAFGAFFAWNGRRSLTKLADYLR